MKFRHTAYLLTLLLSACLKLHAQVAGTVRDANTGEPIPQAAIAAPALSTGVLADDQGRFQLPVQPEHFPLRITIQSTGYQRDSLLLQQPSTSLDIRLEPPVAEAVVITGTFRPSYQGASPIKVEVLSREFIRQVPGANTLMDVVDYVTGVRQQINCGVCGTNDIHINGMEGPYTLVLIDGMPIVSALGSVYGLNGIPSAMIERIEVVKGPASALFGSEAMGGIINVITRDPAQAPLMSAETQLNTHGEWNSDFAVAPSFGKTSTLLAGSYYHMANRIDANGDNFTDVPLSQRLSLFNKWSIRRPANRTATIAAKFYTEDRFGGTLQWQPEHRGSDSIYGESIRTLRTELIGSYSLPTRPAIRLDYSFAHHDQDSWYGNTPYIASQQTAFANLLWAGEWRSHHPTAGLSARHNRYDDNTPATPKADNAFVPGAFFQDEWQPSNRFTLLSGARLDHHPDHGLIFSPRLNLRWKPVAFTTIRLTAGSGFRNVSLFTEEHAALTGARTVVVQGPLAPERSRNLNLNITQAISIGESAGTIDADLFYTHFSNRILPDYDTDPDLIVYRNLEGHAVVRGATLKYSHSFRFPLRAEVGITALQSQSVDGQGIREDQEFVPALEGIYALSYRLPRIRTTFDLNGRITGPMALPTYEAPFERPERSTWFGIHNLQATTQLGHGLQLVMGVRNLLGYTQPSPLINPAQPFSDSFDTAYAYGPLQGRRFIFGLRWQLPR